MSKRMKILAIVLGVVVLAAIAGGSVAAFAADPQPSSTPAVTTTPSTSPQNTFLDNLAKNLNVTVDQLESAMTQARTDTLNQLVANGTITAAQKDWIQNRVQQAQQNGYGPGFGPGFGPGTGRFGCGPFNGALPWNQPSPSPTQ